MLHLSGATQPVHVALEGAEAETLLECLPRLMSVGETALLTTADGSKFAVNFRHVATA